MGNTQSILCLEVKCLATDLSAFLLYEPVKLLLFHNKELARLEVGRRLLLLLLPGNCDKLLGSFGGCSSRAAFLLKFQELCSLPSRASYARHGVHLLPVFRSVPVWREL